jgi:hypothetical protein
MNDNLPRYRFVEPSPIAALLVGFFLCDRINELTNNPKEGYTKDASGHYTSNVGHYTISGAYGGVQLQQIVNEGGGVTTPLGGGYCTKRELADKMRAFISGIVEGKSLTA